MARDHINDPISHCPRGQGGRTFSRLKPGGKKDAPPGVAPNEAHRRNSPSQGLVPMGVNRFPFGKYYDWANDPDKLQPLLTAMNKRRGQ